MNKRKRIETEFGPETRFEVHPGPPAPFQAALESRFERLKNRLLADRLDGLWESRPISQVRRAANEAAALAWVTPYPLLVFPVLFEEKTQKALLVARRQRRVQERSRELMML